MRPPVRHLVCALLAARAASLVDLAGAVIEIAAGAPPRAAAHAATLQREACARLLRAPDGACFPVVSAPAPANATVVIALAVSPAAGPPDGYELGVTPRGLAVTGGDERGLLYGVGALLKRATLTVRRSAAAPAARAATVDTAGWPVRGAPAFPLRLHHVGFNPTNNAYDALPLAAMKQHITELALFGASGVELSVDDAFVVPPLEDSPHFRLDQPSWLAAVSAHCNDLGVDVVLWWALELGNYTDPAVMAAAVAVWRRMFRLLPRLDAVFVPGGDPGGHSPAVMLLAAAALRAELVAAHPAARTWVSAQGFSRSDVDAFFAAIGAPGVADWLDGVVYGPWTTIDLPQFVARTPSPLRVRLYPDICHSLISQYPVAAWDPAHARTAYREAINPRPRAHAAIAALTLPGTAGFGAYSEGVNDDVAKAVWTAAAWAGPSLDPAAAVAEYAAFFLGSTPGLAAAAADLILRLEQNWVGPLRANSGVDAAIAAADALEAAAAPTDRANWRLLQLLYRARYDAYVRGRLAHEDAAEAAAVGALASAPAVGAGAAMDAAEAALAAGAAAASADGNLTRLRADIGRAGAALFALIGAQSSVPLYAAANTERGATLDTLDVPLNNAPFLRTEFARVRALPDEGARLAALAALVGWADAGPGGFHDDLGVEGAEPHLVPGPGPGADPGFLASALHVVARMAAQSAEPLGPPPSFPPLPRPWATLAKSMNDVPLVLVYPSLPPGAAYNVTVVYGGPPVGLGRGLLSLTANGVPVHGPLPPPDPMAALTFAVPPAATAPGGDLVLSCTRAWTDSTSGTGCAVAEVWLRRVMEAGAIERRPRSRDGVH